MEINRALEIISKKTLPDLHFDSGKTESKDAFVNHVSPYIDNLLNHDFSRLVQIIYRIDVAEKDFALTLEIDGGDSPAKKIALLIYNRLLLKAKIRAHYKNRDA